MASSKQVKSSVNLWVDCPFKMPNKAEVSRGSTALREEDAEIKRYNTLRAENTERTIRGSRRTALFQGSSLIAASHPSSSPRKNGDSTETDGSRWRVRSAPPDIRAWQEETFFWGSGHGSSLTSEPFPACISVCLSLPGRTHTTATGYNQSDVVQRFHPQVL